MIRDEQTTYPLPNFRTGQTTDRRLVAEIEASEMSNEAHGTDGPGLFRASGFLIVSQVLTPKCNSTPQGNW